jgi:hypothetical protein
MSAITELLLEKGILTVSELGERMAVIETSCIPSERVIEWGDGTCERALGEGVIWACSGVDAASWDKMSHCSK